MLPSDDIEIDLSRTHEAAQAIRASLLKLRSQHDVRRYEYTSHVRIAPGEIPHSHPVLTLNTRVRQEEALLSVYLHEQMHWYATWCSYARHEEWRSVWKELTRAYPDLPISFPEGARTAASSYLHLIVNFLEIQAVSDFLGHARAAEIASDADVYRGLYRIVLRDWESLSKLYRDYGLLPIRFATQMTAKDLALAARMEESS